MAKSYQIILEIRFNENLKFKDNNFINDVTSNLTSNGFGFNMLGNNVDAFNVANQIHFSTNSVRCGIDYTSQELNFNKFKQNIQPLLNLYNRLEIRYLLRIGLRISCFSNYESLASANDKIKSIIKIDNKNLESLKSNCEGFSMSFNKKNNKCDTRVSIIPRQINVNTIGIEQHINMLNLDIDVSESDISIAQSLFDKYSDFFNIIKDYNEQFKDVF